MPTSQVNIKIDSKLKRQAERIADKLGLNLSVVLRALLAEFVRLKRLDVSLDDTPENLTGPQLAKNLIKDGWSEKVAKKHGKAYDDMLQAEKDGTLIEL